MALFEILSIETGAPLEVIERIVRSAPRRYKVYEIPKRNGGTRTIAHPARELKILQRTFLHTVLDSIAVSEAATAYVKGRGIGYNALKHAGQAWLLKLDFKDFFHSIKPADWDRIVRRTPELSQFARERVALHRLLFWELTRKSNTPTCLSIGAPTSPSVSNLACRKLDQWLLDSARDLDLVVTRYADDITISGANPRNIRFLEASFYAALAKNKGLNLSLNEKKRGLYGPGERRMVTGLILTPEGKVSIGRERKRLISSMIHKFSISQLTPAEALKARGLLAFALSVEPSFFEAMKNKYPASVVDDLMKIDSLGALTEDHDF